MQSQQSGHQNKMSLAPCKYSTRDMLPHWLGIGMQAAVSMTHQPEGPWHCMVLTGSTPWENRALNRKSSDELRLRVVSMYSQ